MTTLYIPMHEPVELESLDLVRLAYKYRQVDGRDRETLAAFVKEFERRQELLDALCDWCGSKRDGSHQFEWKGQKICEPCYDNLMDTLGDD